MTKDEIIQMAKKCGWDNPATNMMPLYEFAKLIANHEREECAKMCDYVYENIVTDEHIKDMAFKIRAKDQKMKPEDIGPLLKKKREDLELKQQQVASFIGCSRVSVSQWETGRSKPPLEHFLALLTLYNMKIDELI